MANLEIFSADQAGVDVDPAKTDGAELLEVEVKNRPVNGVEVGALL